MAIATPEAEAAFPSGQPEAIPPLENGDRLTRADFERRYDAMTGLKKAELIDGRVYMPSPVKRRHGRPHSKLVAWLVVYESATPGVEASDNTTVRFDEENEPQPDVSLAVDAALGGQSRIDEDDYLAGPPELVAEVASSSASYDLHEKLHLYRLQGVREYVVWRVRDRAIDWFRLAEGQYVPLAKDSAGILKSSVFPGLWLDVEAMLQGDMARVLAVLQDGLRSPEHASFVQSLEQRKA
jgi:Uma2 family endonuclease